MGFMSCCWCGRQRSKLDFQTYHLLQLSGIVDPMASGWPGTHPRRVRSETQADRGVASAGHSRRVRSDGDGAIGAIGPFTTARQAIRAPSLTGTLDRFADTLDSLHFLSRSDGSRRFLSEGQGPTPAVRNSRRVRSEGRSARGSNTEDFEDVVLGHMGFQGEYQVPTIPFNTPAPKSSTDPKKDTEEYFAGRHPLYPPSVPDPNTRRRSALANNAFMVADRMKSITLSAR
jgi:hypothetical protein